MINKSLYSVLAIGLLLVAVSSTLAMAQVNDAAQINCNKSTANWLSPAVIIAKIQAQGFSIVDGKNTSLCGWIIAYDRNTGAEVHIMVNPNTGKVVATR